ncbi:hypothetical protein R3P38DRAFT_2787548 [Favolaschia claudopus]|uniref:Uncharacterized protein n=1 Tax=Favolaschia claudopus TaxID=2862362 RepID=A0AAW0ANX5_9AGAR
MWSKQPRETATHDYQANTSSGHSSQQTPNEQLANPESAIIRIFGILHRKSGAPSRTSACVIQVPESILFQISWRFSTTMHPMSNAQTPSQQSSECSAFFTAKVVHHRGRATRHTGSRVNYIPNVLAIFHNSAPNEQRANPESSKSGLRACPNLDSGATRRPRTFCLMRFTASRFNVRHSSPQKWCTIADEPRDIQVPESIIFQTSWRFSTIVHPMSNAQTPSHQNQG